MEALLPKALLPLEQEKAKEYWDGVVLRSDAVRKIVDSWNDNGAGWSVWEDTPVKILKKVSQDGSKRMIGLARHEFPVEKDGITLTCRDLETFIQNAESKKIYDPMYMECLHVYMFWFDDATKEYHPTVDMGTTSRYSIVDYQVFNGKYGVGPREFYLSVDVERDFDSKEKTTINRTTLSARSLHDKAEKDAEKAVKDHFSDNIISGATRANAIMACYDIKLSDDKSKISISYLMQVDPKTSMLIPNWAVERIQLNQLEIIAAIPDACRNFIKEKNKK